MGPYCFQCGQRHGHSVRSVWHFTREATEDLTHADSRLWRTLYALLLRPGALTREYLDGHRVRYLPPMRLYLILSLLFFLIASLVPPTESIVRIVDTPAGTHIIREPTQGMVFHVPPAQIDPTCHKILQGMRPVWSTLGGREQPLMASCRKTFSDGGASLREAYLRNLPDAMFLLVPVLALFPLLMYWRPRHYYVEHLLFFVHNHAFGFLIYTLDMLVGMATPRFVGNLVELAINLYVGIYLYRAMRRVYGQGRTLTLVKLAALAFVYCLASTIALASTALYSVLTL